MSVISYPIPPFQNLPIRADFFQPSVFVISNIQRGTTTLVTTTLNTNYVIGQEVRLIIPSGFGCEQINGRKGFVLSFNAPNIVNISIDSSRNVTRFNLSATVTIQSPQIAAVGDINTGITSSTGQNIPSTNIPGAFINISPL